MYLHDAQNRKECNLKMLSVNAIVWNVLQAVIVNKKYFVYILKLYYIPKFRYNTPKLTYGSRRCEQI